MAGYLGTAIYKTYIYITVEAARWDHEEARKRLTEPGRLHAQRRITCREPAHANVTDAVNRALNLYVGQQCEVANRH